MAIKNKQYFTEQNATALKRGDRFLDEHKPSEETLRHFNDSKLHKTAVDRAKEDDSSVSVNELSGHAVAATDAQAKSNEAKKSDRTIFVQSSQLPNVEPKEDNQEYTVAKLKADYTNDTDVSFDDNTIQVELSDDTTKNVYQISQKSTYRTFIGLFIDSFNDIVSKVKALKTKQDSQQTQINGLTSASGNVGELINQLAPVGSTYFHLSPQSVSNDYWGVADGVTEYPKYITPGDPGSGETSGYELLKTISGMLSDGTDTNNFIINSFEKKIPYQESDLSTGFGGQASWYVPLAANQIPRHNHDFGTLSTDNSGGHTHVQNDYSFEGNSGSKNENIASTSKKATTPGGLAVSAAVQFKTSNAGAHSHAITGSTGFSSGPNSSNLTFEPPKIKGGWIVKIK